MSTSARNEDGGRSECKSPTFRKQTDFLTHYHNAIYAALKYDDFDVIDALVSGDLPLAESEPAPASVTDTPTTSHSTVSSLDSE